MDNLGRLDKVEKVTRVEDTLEVLKTIGKLIGEMFGKKCEVAISDLDEVNQSVIWIINGNVTGRHVGSPLNKDANERLLDLEKGYRFNYSKVSGEKGKELKASTLVFDIGGRKYSFCVNYDINLEKQISWAMQSFLSMQQDTIHVDEIPDANTEIIENIVKGELLNYDKLPAELTREERIQVIHSLYHLELFKRQKSVPIVANIMEVSRYTIYNDIKLIKEKHDK